MTVATSVESAIETDQAYSAIYQAAMDYIEGWYAGDVARMERSLHPDLAKRLITTTGQGRSRIEQMSALGLVQNTRAGLGTQTPLERQKREFRLLDRFENMASVRVDASDWVDYMHLAYYNGTWVIVNVLWELKQAN